MFSIINLIRKHHFRVFSALESHFSSRFSEIFTIFTSLRFMIFLCHFFGLYLTGEDKNLITNPRIVLSSPSRVGLKKVSWKNIKF